MKNGPIQIVLSSALILTSPQCIAAQDAGSQTNTDKPNEAHSTPQSELLEKERAIAALNLQISEMKSQIDKIQLKSASPDSRHVIDSPPQQSAQSDPIGTGRSSSLTTTRTKSNDSTDPSGDLNENLTYGIFILLAAALLLFRPLRKIFQSRSAQPAKVLASSDSPTAIIRTPGKPVLPDLPHSVIEQISKVDTKHFFSCYPHLEKKITLLWGHPECVKVIESLLTDSRAFNRAGFSLQDIRTILALQALHDELYPQHTQSSEVWNVAPKSTHRAINR